MVRMSEGGSRCVPMSLACDGIVCARMCLNKDVGTCLVACVLCGPAVSCALLALVWCRLCACAGGKGCGWAREGWGSETVASVACLVVGRCSVCLSTRVQIQIQIQ